VAEPDPAAAPVPVDGGVELWTPGDGTWRWRYAERAVSIALTSNEAFTGRAEAIEAARDVYPGVPVRQVDPPGGPAVIAEQRRRRRLARFLAAGGWLALRLLGRRRSRR
jgi:hypothetical protein